MKYGVMTTWKHNNPIDWDGAEWLIGDDMPDGSTVQWLAIECASEERKANHEQWAI